MPGAAGRLGGAVAGVKEVAQAGRCGVHQTEGHEEGGGAENGSGRGELRDLI